MKSIIELIAILCGKRLLPFMGDVAFKDPIHATKPFAPHFEQHIRPLVNQFEQNRIKSLQKLRTNSVVAVSLILLIIFGIIILYINVDNRNVTSNTTSVAGAIILAICVWWFLPISNYKSAVKSSIFPRIFKFFGNDFYYCHMNTGLSIKSLIPSNILPKHDEADTEDYIQGSYKGVSLQIVEANLKKVRRNSNGGRSRRTIFKGIFIQVDLHKKFSGKTIVKKDYGMVANMLGDKFNTLDTVRLEDPVFEKMFQVYSDDQVEARYLLTTSFMDRLINLADIFGGKGIQCSFYDDKLLFMIPSKQNRFETGSIFTPATFEPEINTILAEMSEIFQIIDVLKLNEHTGL
jgi:hypothetical protein